MKDQVRIMEDKKAYPSRQTLVEDRAASRVYAKDATLYSFSEEAEEHSSNFMGWTDLATNPPCPLDEITALARSFIDRGFELAILIGQGGSTQAAMTMTKYFKDEATGMLMKGHKRHPNVEDNVVVYAGATILGGETTIGHDSEIGGNVWLMESIPPFSRVYNQTPYPRIKPKKES